jgi:N-acetyl-alpha-D-muramate 1-phosphate uridylyltransferase
MKAMILAAGLGTRLRPLTETVPKPLLPLAGKPMIQYHIEQLVRLGISELVINVSWLGTLIEQRLGDGSALGARIRYSREPDGPLDTGGGLRRALPLLGDEPFLLIAGDIWSDFPLQRLLRQPLRGAQLGRLVLVPNPAQHSQGDFSLGEDGLLGTAADGERRTYAGLALLSPALLAGWDEEVFPLREPLRNAAARGLLLGEPWDGDWEDVGTPERYQALNQRLAAR